MILDLRVSSCYFLFSFLLAFPSSPYGSSDPNSGDGDGSLTKEGGGGSDPITNLIDWLVVLVATVVCVEVRIG